MLSRRSAWSVPAEDIRPCAETEFLSDVQCEELCGSVLPSGGNTWPGKLRYSQNLTIYVRRMLTWCHSQRLEEAFPAKVAQCVHGCAFGEVAAGERMERCEQSCRLQRAGGWIDEECCFQAHGSGLSEAGLTRKRGGSDRERGIGDGRRRTENIFIGGFRHGHSVSFSYAMVAFFCPDAADAARVCRRKLRC